MERTLARFTSSALVLLIVQIRAWAVVVGSTTANTTAPPDPTFPWNNIGVTAGATGVYLGDRWVLTAYHVHGGSEPTSIAFPGVGTFAAEPGSKIEIPNTDSSLSDFADLALFRLQETPGLPPLPISAVTPNMGTEVYLVGNGRDRQVDHTYWDADISPGRTIWTQTDESGKYLGYKTVGANSLRWGTNLIEDDERLVWDNGDSDHTIVRPLLGRDTVMLITEFDRDGYSNSYVSNPGAQSDTSYEAQAVLGDSGGGMFVQTNGRWELAGIINSVEGHNKQDAPGAPHARLNALYGNMTFSANLADYRDSILSLSNYQIGDFDGDGQLTLSDINLLTGVVLSSVDPPAFDLNGDGTVDHADRKTWVEELAFTYFGDSNFDGQFNSRDLVTVFQDATYEDSIRGNSSWTTGDWNGDHEFDSSDLVLAFRQATYEKGPRSRSTNGAIVVPEPSPCVALVVCGTFFTLPFRRLKNRHYGMLPSPDGGSAKLLTR